MSIPSRSTDLPRLVFAANLWTLVEHPSAKTEWTLEEKYRAVRDAGFQGVNCDADVHTGGLVKKFGLRFSGGCNIQREEDIARLLHEQMEAGAENINVQLGRHDMPAAEALHLTLRLMEESDRQNANVHLETHRGTCTETPEKTYALADAYHQATGKVLRMNMDYSHFAVVKHLQPEDFSRRLLERPELLQNGNLIHLRPFNGHHCQIPVTDGHGALTSEMQDYLEFVEDVFRCWLAGPRPHNELWVVPELGPVSWGYGLSSFPPVWEDAIVAKRELEKIWNKVLGLPDEIKPTAPSVGESAKKPAGFFTRLFAELNKPTERDIDSIVTANFTPRAQQALTLARKEAERLKANFVGTEHLLLGLISLGQGVAVNVLARLGINLETARSEVEKQIGSHPGRALPGEFSYTPGLKNVIVLAGRDARRLEHAYVGTEHLLLGMLSEGGSMAGRVLKSLGVQLEATRIEILRELDPNFERSGTSETSRSSVARETVSASPLNNFTTHAQWVLAHARREAHRLSHNFVGTEHVLLGVLKLDQGLALELLKKSGLDPETGRQEVEKSVGRGPEQKIVGNIPYTPRVKKVLALAIKEAGALKHKYVGPEHILLGLLYEGDGVAARIMKNHGMNLDAMRKEIGEKLDPNVGL